MLSRCYNKNKASFSRYGGIGIVVCDDWRNSFENFYRDMGPRPSKMTLDRIDPDGKYSPDNCRWATRLTQTRNRQRRRQFELPEGVNFNRGKYRAQIQRFGHRVFLGRYNTSADASSVYETVKSRIGEIDENLFLGSHATLRGESIYLMNCDSGRCRFDFHRPPYRRNKCTMGDGYNYLFRCRRIDYEH
jgi:hypothetical protein